MENQTSWITGKRAVAVFALSLIFPAIIGWFSYQSISGLIEANYRITHAQKMLADLELLQQLSAQAEARAHEIMWIFSFSSLLTLGLLAAATWMIKREFDARERAAAEIRARAPRFAQMKDAAPPGARRDCPSWPIA